MVNKIIALTYILMLGVPAILLVASAFADRDFDEKRAIAIFAFTNVLGFLSNSYWLFVGSMSVLLYLTLPKQKAIRVAAFMFLFPLMPSLEKLVLIGGVPLIQISWTRFLILILLLPMLADALAHRAVFRLPLDKYVLAFSALLIALESRDVSFTASMRNALEYSLDILLPYLVISRQIRSWDELRQVFTWLLAGLTFLGMLNLFETIRNWHPHHGIVNELTNTMTRSVSRGGFARAFGPMDKASASSFALALGCGIYWILYPLMQRKVRNLLPIIMLVGGLIVTFSRGGWVASAIIGAGAAATSKVRNFAKAAIWGAILVTPIAMFTDVGQFAIQALPFVGQEDTAEARTVDYRVELFSAGLEVAAKYPLFGTPNLQQEPAMIAITQASGLLDLVNHYMLLLLNYGSVGLVLFLLIFARTLLLLWTTRALAGPPNSWEKHACTALAFTLGALLVQIITTSALNRVGLILWCIVAIVAAMHSITQAAIHKSR